VHSVKSITNLRRELTNLGRYAKQELGIKHIDQIDISTVRSWIGSKEIGYRTASNYLSNLNKIESHLNITREEIRELRQELSPSLKRPQFETRAYRNLDRLQVPQRAEPAFRLQRDYGLRPGAAREIQIIKEPTNIHQPDFKGTHLKENILHYREKGGKMAQKTLDRETIQVIEKNAQNGSCEINAKTYSRDLEKALRNDGQEFNGAHGIRHTYAQRQLEDGKTKQEVSEQMGHAREEITNTYLR
jgi:integrase